MLVYKQLRKTLIVTQANRFADLNKISAENKLLIRSINYPFKEGKFSREKMLMLQWRLFIDRIEAPKSKNIRDSYLKA